jgi:putative transposase
MKTHEAYQALPRKVSQQVLRMLHKNWQSFPVAIKAYDAHSSRFKKRPGLPKLPKSCSRLSSKHCVSFPEPATAIIFCALTETVTRPPNHKH